MKILSLKPGHDASVVYIDNGRLLFSIEAEKDSFPRYSELTPQLIIQAMEMAPDVPDVVAIVGWHKFLPNLYASLESGYFGLKRGNIRDTIFLGKPVKLFSSSHERSHIFMATSMAPGAPLRECVVLVWEGELGSFYHWQEYGAKISSCVNNQA